MRAVVKATREDSDVSRRALDELMGWENNQTKNIEIGRRAISGVELIRVARALNIPPDALMRRILRWRMS